MNKGSFLKHVSWMALCVIMMALKPAMAMESDSDEEASSSRSSGKTSVKSKKRRNDAMTPKSVDASKMQTDKLDSSKSHKKRKLKEKTPEEDDAMYFSGDTSSSISGGNPSPSSALTTSKEMRGEFAVPKKSCS